MVIEAEVKIEDAVGPEATAQDVEGHQHILQCVKTIQGPGLARNLDLMIRV